MKIRDLNRITLGLSLMAAVLSTYTFAQSTLHCEDCHSSEKADWMLGKHSNTQADVAGELAANWAGQAPDSVIHGSSAEDCLACHAPAAVSMHGGMTEVQGMGLFFTTTGGLYTDSTGVADAANWPHVACVSCHNVPGNHPGSMPVISIFRSNTAMYDSVATTSVLCGQCHGTLRYADTDHRVYDAWKLSRHGHGGQTDLAGELASSWAGLPPDSVINGPAAENCIACHTPAAVPQNGSLTEVDILRRFFTTTGGMFTASTTAADTTHWPEMSCNSCHNPHNPGALSYYNSSTKSYTIMTESSKLCGQCHGSLRFPDTDHRSYDLELGTGGVGVSDKVTMPGAACVDCHMATSDVDGTNSLMFKGHRWSPVLREPDGSSFASCTSCHAGMSADSSIALIASWKAEYESLDSTAEAMYTTADSIAQATHNQTKINLVTDARHNLDMVETDESGGFHNHLYTVALLNDAIDRTGQVLGVKTNPAAMLPARFDLFQNYPNPFNPTTTIRYALPKKSHVTLTVCNALGQIVVTLTDAEQEAGYHEARFNGTKLASGMYLYRIQAGEYVQTKKLLLIK